MSLNETFEDSVVGHAEFRGTRIASATVLIVGTSVLTQVMVLSSVAIIMGVAIVTMCAVMVELIVLSVVATILERGMVNVEDVGTLMEIAATVLITGLTLVLAATGGRQATGKAPDLGGSIAAFKLR